MRYSIAQWQDFLRQGGWPEDLIVMAAAVGMAESGGDSAIPGDQGCSWGFLQINLCAHPEYGRDEVLDPVGNARAAWEIYQRQGWPAWKNTVYVNKHYLRFMPASQAAYGGASPGANGVPADDALAAADVAGGIDPVTFGLVLGGLLLLAWILKA